MRRERNRASQLEDPSTLHRAPNDTSVLPGAGKLVPPQCVSSAPPANQRLPHQMMFCPSSNFGTLHLTKHRTSSATKLRCQREIEFQAEEE